VCEEEGEGGTVVDLVAGDEGGEEVGGFDVELGGGV